MDYVSDAKKKHVGGYIPNTVKVLESWPAFNDIQLTRKLEIKDASETPRLKDERA